MDFAKERQLTDVVLFAYWKVGTSNKLLPAVLSTGCGNRSPLPQFPHKWNNYSAVVKAWKPSEEKQHYLENYFNTKMKLSRGTPCPVSHAENTSAFKYPAPAREEKKIYIYMDGVKEPQFQVLQGGIFSARVSLREERQCADLQPHKSGSRKKPPDFFFFHYSFLWSFKPA